MARHGAEAWKKDCERCVAARPSGAWGRLVGATPGPEVQSGVPISA
jgi:hypothetical protein